jgi:3-oxoacyl-[acyl-carrier-protein] synthase-3
LRWEDPYSAWFGDGATAVVVGPVSKDRGVLARQHMTASHLYASVVTGVPGGRWYEGGRSVVYLESPALCRRQFLEIPDQCQTLTERALAEAGVGKDAIRFWACHQGTAWLGRLTQEYLGLEHAARVDTFPWATSLSGANLPLVLSVGEREGQIQPGDVVGLFAGSAGATVTSMLIRWGR